MEQVVPFVTVQESVFGWPERKEFGEIEKVVMTGSARLVTVTVEDAGVAGPKALLAAKLYVVEVVGVKIFEVPVTGVPLMEISVALVTDQVQVVFEPEFIDEGEQLKEAMVGT
jgi:hypothetical protein